MNVAPATEFEPAAEVPGHLEPRTSALDVLRRRKWALLLALVLVPAAALAASLRQSALYEAKAEVLLSRQNLAASLTGTQDPNLFLGVEGAERLALTQADLARTSTLARRVITAAGTRARTPAELLASSTVSVKENRDLLEFTVRDSNRWLASWLATNYAREFTKYRAEIDTAALGRARSAVQTRIGELEAKGDRNSPLYASLVDKEQQLLTMEALATSNAFLVSEADPATQVQPRPLRNSLLGLGFGLFLGLMLAFLWEAIDTRVRTADEIAARLDLPLLGRVPEPPRHLRAKNQLVMLAEPHGEHSEAFRLLRTNLSFVNLDRGARTIMFTSAVASEGKSTTAANLAVALAREGRRVILVDLDVRRPYLARFFGLEERLGLTDAVLGEIPLARAIAKVRVARQTRGGGVATVQAAPEPSLAVVPLGSPPPNPGEFVGSKALADFLQKLADKADIVIVDAPPLLQVGDAMTLSARVDALILVTRMNVLRRPALRELSRALRLCPSVPLGFVITGAEAAHGYGYGAYYRERHDGGKPNGRAVVRYLGRVSGRRPRAPVG